MKKKNLFHVLGFSIFALNSVFGACSQAHAKQLKTIQEQSISKHFPLNKIIIAEEPGFKLGVVTLGKAHRRSEYLFKLQYGNGFAKDIVPLLYSFHTYASEP